jgi:hypothetical protein
MAFCVLFVYLLSLVSVAFGVDSIVDPIRDYLLMDVADRKEYVGTVESLSRVTLDLDGDGKDEVFVGAWYRYSGSKSAFYWTGYAPVDGGYRRITSATEDVYLQFDDIYVGFIQECSSQGLVQAYGVKFDDSDSGIPSKIEGVTFYYINNGSLTVMERGALDLSNQADKAFFEKYFGPMRKTRRVTKVESFTADKLRQKGYIIPNWESPAP